VGSFISDFILQLGLGVEHGKVARFKLLGKKPGTGLRVAVVEDDFSGAHRFGIGEQFVAVGMPA
jgi:hypothetical protein